MCEELVELACVLLHTYWNPFRRVDSFSVLRVNMQPVFGCKVPHVVAFTWPLKKLLISDFMEVRFLGSSYTSGNDDNKLCWIHSTSESWHACFFFPCPTFPSSCFSCSLWSYRRGSRALLKSLLAVAIIYQHYAWWNVQKWRSKLWPWNGILPSLYLIY